MNDKYTWFKALWPLILATCISIIPLQAHAQKFELEYLYGKWENTGSFKDGEQQLLALKDTLENPKTYYFTFFKNGTFTYDVISLDPLQDVARRSGNWHLSPDRKKITLIDNLINPEERKIPGDFLNFETDGSLASKPVIYPIIELTSKKLVLYDEYHKTLDIFRKK
ncbi:hypothetical protein [Muriicola marianensis]|uniref:DUF4488 domain-containing protein n=1 Tax=Muriicola marianensis TaxID=1324801 RepID=A0ABQ1QPU4_9FLAO|nr:hypothetical protein [Muriicola marianensis]GGD39970.1 hypothetical protein GCM10011361_03830 [Muriicola marianensis]